MNIIETNLNFGNLTKRAKTVRAILHHAAASTCSAEDIHRWHLANKWAGAGYHFLVRKDGSVYRLRPEWAVGAHASGNNSDSIGICFEGNFMTEAMPEAQKQAGKELVAWVKGKYGFTKVQAHRDVQSTSCPGTNFPFNEIVNGGTAQKPVKPEPQKPESDTGADSVVRDGQVHARNFASPGLVADGIRGANTKRAGIRALQQAMNLDYHAGLALDGIWGTKSERALGRHTVRRGETQYMVTALQILLMLKGYNPGGLENPGIFGSGTEAAVRKYQADHGLTVDGIAGYNTFKSLIQ